MKNIEKYANIAEVISVLKPINSIYCLNTKNVSAQVKLFQQYFFGTVSWAVKSNPEKEVIKAIYESGIRNFDVASISEIKMIQKLCPTGRIHFNHPVKSAEAIKEAYYKYKVKIFVADHQDEIEKISSVLMDKTDILLLIRFFDPNIVPASIVNFATKFGVSPKDASESLIFAKKIGFQKFGVTFHPSTQYPDPNIYEHLLKIAKEIQDSVIDHKINFELINIGGGFPVPYPSEKVPDLKDYLKSVSHSIRALKKHFQPDCEFLCEPGRALVASCANLITRIELNKHDGRIYLNDGFYGCLMEQHFVDYLLPVQIHTHDNRKLSENLKEYSLFGPTCDSVDILKKKYMLPSDLQIGDYLVFGLLGAYSNAVATSFNGFKPAKIIHVQKLG